MFSSNIYPSPMHTPTLICMPLPIPVLVCIPHSALLPSHLSSLPLDSLICVLFFIFLLCLFNLSPKMCSHFKKNFPIYSPFTLSNLSFYSYPASYPTKLNLHRNCICCLSTLWTVLTPSYVYSTFVCFSMVFL